MTTKYKIPDDLRLWAEAAAPTLTLGDWDNCEKVARNGGAAQLSIGLVEIFQVRALLAYADGVAARLTENMQECLVVLLASEDGEVNSSGWRSTPNALMAHGLVEYDSFAGVRTIKLTTPWGRYIAGVVWRTRR